MSAGNPDRKIYVYVVFTVFSSLTFPFSKDLRAPKILRVERREKFKALLVWGVPSFFFQNKTGRRVGLLRATARVSLWYPHILGPPLPESRGARILFRPSWKMWRIFLVKFFAATFPGNQRSTTCNIFSPNFAACFAHVSEKFAWISLSGISFITYPTLHEEFGCDTLVYHNMRYPVCDSISRGMRDRPGYLAQAHAVRVLWIKKSLPNIRIGHFLRGRSLKDRCNICVYVPVRVPVCVCVCPSSPPPLTPPILWGWTAEFPPHPYMSPHLTPFPHPYPQAIARPTLGQNYPLKSAWQKHGSPKTWFVPPRKKRVLSI